MSTVSFPRAALEARMRGAVVKALDGALILLQREMRLELSKEGTGKSYRRGKGSVSGRNVREEGYHIASAPGEPPAADTGTLRRSWQVGSRGLKTQNVLDRSGLRSRMRPTIRLGTAVRYARWLEYGTGRMAPRPYVQAPIRRLARNGAIDRLFRAELSKVVGARAASGLRIRTTGGPGR